MGLVGIDIAQQVLDDQTQIIDGFYHFDLVAIGAVDIHQTIAAAPGFTFFRGQPEHVTGFLADFVQYPVIGLIVVIASISQNDKGRSAAQVFEIIFS